MQENTKSLPVTLTAAEIEQRSKTLARRIVDLGDLEEEKKEVVKGFGERIKAAEAEIQDLAEAVNTGKEKRLVAVYERHDKRRFCVETVRADTEEVIETRAMNEDECNAARQPSLFSDDARTGERAERPPVVPLHPPACPDCGELGMHKLDCPAVGNTATQSAPVRVKVEGGEECSKCGRTDVHLENCPVALETLALLAASEPKPEPKRACKACGIVGTHRPDCPGEDEAPQEGDVTDPAALLAAAAPKTTETLQ